MKKENKTIAGYQLLMFLSTIDNTFDVRADAIIQEYILKETPFPINWDGALEQIIALEETEQADYFKQIASDFFDDSTEQEREEFLIFAKSLIRADEEISDSENKYYRLLLKTWAAKEK